MKLGKKKTGGKYIKRRKKKSYELAGQKNILKIGQDKRKSKKIQGTNKQTILLKAKFVNILRFNLPSFLLQRTLFR